MSCLKVILWEERGVRGTCPPKILKITQVDFHNPKFEFMMDSYDVNKDYYLTSVLNYGHCSENIFDIQPEDYVTEDKKYIDFRNAGVYELELVQVTRDWIMAQY